MKITLDHTKVEEHIKTLNKKIEAVFKVHLELQKLNFAGDIVVSENISPVTIKVAGEHPVEWCCGIVAEIEQVMDRLSHIPNTEHDYKMYLNEYNPGIQYSGATYINDIYFHLTISFNLDNTCQIIEVPLTEDEIGRGTYYAPPTTKQVIVC